MNLAPDFRDLLEELGRDAVEFVLIGGYAVAYHGRPRATKDIDLFLAGDVDFLRSVDGVRANELLADAEIAVIDGLKIKVISRAHLIANKRAAGRPQDLLDAEFLERGSSR